MSAGLFYYFFSLTVFNHLFKLIKTFSASNPIQTVLVLLFVYLLKALQVGLYLIYQTLLFDIYVLLHVWHIVGFFAPLYYYIIIIMAL